MRKFFLFVCLALCGFVAKAASIDCTNLVDVTWGNTSECQTQYAPAVTPYGYSYSVKMRENYQSNVDATGELISQTLTGLTNGTYTVELYANAFYTSDRGFSSDVTEGAIDVAYVFANDEKTAVTAKIATSTTANGEYSITVTVTDGRLKIGIGKWKAGTNWHTIQIKSLSREATAEDAYAEALNAAKAVDKTQPMNATVKADLETALSTYATATDDTYETAATALNAATVNATTSIKEYATAANVLPLMKALTESTNVYTSDALSTYYTQYQTAYDNRTLTSEQVAVLKDPHTQVYGKSAGFATVQNFLLSAWDVTDKSGEGDYYINTWSTEGESDGSGFIRPFYEYWTSDGGSLAAKTMTATISGLAEGLYSVTASVRVHQTSTATLSGITMQVNDGTAVDVCKGTHYTFNTTHHFYVDNFTATGTVGSDGKLTLKFIVAADNNISWLSFKNVNYAAVTLDVSALSSAISTANFLNKSITNGVSALATAITAAEKVVTAATSQDEIDTEVTTLNAAIESAKTVIAARLKANGYYKKYTALNNVINDNTQTDAINALKTVYENADATADDVTKALAAVTLLDSYTKLDIANGTFDECINFDQTGTNNGTMISPATTAKPYLWDIKDWTWHGTFNGTASHVNAAYYGTTLANTNQGTNGTNPPATDMFGATDGQALHMSSGWGDKARYQQSVKLPAGKYVFYYEAYNANSGAKTLDSNYFGIGGVGVLPNADEVLATSGSPSVKVGSENRPYINENSKTFEYGEWTPAAMNFTLIQNEDTAYVTIGVVAATGKSAYGAKLWVDNVEVYYIPATMATYTREATVSGYGTICLPYAAKGAENVTVYEIEGTDNVENPTTIYLTEVESMVAGTPYIYYAGADGTAAEAVFTQTNTTTVESPVSGKNNLTGVFTGGKGIIANDSYILSDGKWYKVDNSSDFTCGDNRAYIFTFTGMNVVTDESSDVKTMSIIDNDATSISGVENAAKLSTANIYTLSGQRVKNVSKGGIYIVNGKKVFVK